MFGFSVRWFLFRLWAIIFMTIPYLVVRKFGAGSGSAGMDVIPRMTVILTAILGMEAVSQNFLSEKFIFQTSLRIRAISSRI